MQRIHTNAKNASYSGRAYHEDQEKEMDRCKDADDAENADDHGDSNEDSRGTEGGRENCSEIIQTTAADFGPVLAEITKILIFYTIN